MNVGKSSKRPWQDFSLPANYAGLQLFPESPNSFGKAPGKLKRLIG